jgi:hypothetical protein
MLQSLVWQFLIDVNRYHMTQKSHYIFYSLEMITYVYTKILLVNTYETFVCNSTKL